MKLLGIRTVLFKKLTASSWLEFVGYDTIDFLGSLIRNEWVSIVAAFFEIWRLNICQAFSVVYIQCSTRRDKCSNITREKSEIQNEMWEITIDIKEESQNTWQREFAGNFTNKWTQARCGNSRQVSCWECPQKVVPGKTHSHNTFSSDRTKNSRFRTCDDLSLTFKLKEG